MFAPLDWPAVRAPGERASDHDAQMEDQALHAARHSGDSYVICIERFLVPGGGDGGPDEWPFDIALQTQPQLQTPLHLLLASYRIVSVLCLGYLRPAKYLPRYLPRYSTYIPHTYGVPEYLVIFVYTILGQFQLVGIHHPQSFGILSIRNSLSTIATTIITRPRPVLLFNGD